jgi:arylsulfatase A-like enzyme
LPTCRSTRVTITRLTRPTNPADHASSWIRAQKSLTPGKPFFIYYAAPGTHAPSQVPTEWLDKYKGKFDEGWDKYREEILARQKQLGIVPPNTRLTPKPKEMPDWDTLSDDEKKVFTRQQEIFAAYAEITDHEVGRVVRAIEDMGVMGNTLIIYITGDNGSSAGGRNGRFNSLYSYNQIPETIAGQLKHFDEFGGPHPDMTPPLGWAIADNTPFAYAQGNTSFGGTTNGIVVHWPAHINAKGEIRPQYHHIIDIAPTVLEAAGLPQPKIVNGTPQKPIEGVSITIPFIFGAETADVGEDLYSPVTDDYEKGDNKFTGKINKVTIDPKKMSPVDEDTAEKAAQQTDAVRADQDRLAF